MARTSRKRPAPAATPAPIETETAPEAAPHASESLASHAEKPIRILTFFEGLKRIQPDDWGSRANIYLYRLEPITDRLKGGNSFVFVMKYDEPIDQDKVLMDQGSGKYRAVLTFKKPGQNDSDQVDSAVFEMLNTAFPPKIPPGEWVNDPRNKKWAWARPAGAPMANGEQPTRPIDDTVEKFRLFNEMRSSVAEEIVKTHPKADEDPYTKAMSMAKDLLQMRSDNPMVDVLRDELKSMREDMRAERDRAERLREELSSKENGQPKPATGLGFLKEIITEAKGMLPDLKEMFPGFGQKLGEAAAQVATRSRMSGTEEFWQPIVTGVLDSLKPVLPVIVTRIMTAQDQKRQPQSLQPQQPGPQALPQPGAAPTGQPQPAAPPVNGAAATQPPPSFLQRIAPALMNHLRDDMSGADFAEWIFSGFGAEIDNLSWVGIKNAIGADSIVQMFRESPYWQELSLTETKFTKFIQEFVAWQPEAPQDAIEPQYEEVNAEQEIN